MTPPQTTRVVASVVFGCLACAPAALSSRDPESPPAVLVRAIARAGGAAALMRAKALTWDGDATIHADGRTISITGQWKIQPPDTAIVATYDVSRGSGTVRSLIIAAPRGWTLSAGQFAPLPAPMIANERDEFYVYDVIRLVPLLAPGVTLTRIAPDSLGNNGFKAEQNGRPAVDVYVDAKGALRHLRLLVANPRGGDPVTQDAWLEGTLEADGVRWPRSLHLTMNGAQYFDLTMRSLRVLPRLEDPLLAGPR
jgi:hypothetical protein